MRTMKALVLEAPETLRLREINVQEPVADEILIRVHACGVCGTDLHMFHGDKGAFENRYPLIMGHEFAGEVVSCGPLASKFKPGDHVAVDPNLYCGKCPACLRGDVHFCENMVGIGTTQNGGFAEYCTVSEQAAYLVPHTVPYEFAAMMEPISCCLHGIDRCNIRPGDTVAIIGFGSIGQIMFQLANHAGAARVIVVEPVAEKREKALQMGAFLTCDPSAGEIGRTLHVGGAERISTVIECVGRKDAMETAVSIAANRGTVMLFGLTAPGTKLEILPYEHIFQKELTITGSFINPMVAQRVLDLIVYKKLDMGQIIAQRLPLQDGLRAFTDKRLSMQGKVVIGNF